MKNATDFIQNQGAATGKVGGYGDSWFNSGLNDTPGSAGAARKPLASKCPAEIGALLSQTSELKELWAKVANERLESTGDEGRAVHEANAVVARQAERVQPAGSPAITRHRAR
jgi:hypothetical protein